MVTAQTATPAPTLDKTAKAAWKTNHDLHVLLIQKKHGLSKADASVQAYHEGIEGLNKRLG